jgi:hypothetical protein
MAPVEQICNLQHPHHAQYHTMILLV